MHIRLFFYLSILLLNNYNRKERVKGVRNDFFFQLRLRLETVAWVGRLLLRGLLPYRAGDHLPYLLGDGEGLEDEAFGELGEVLLGKREDEVVAVVASEGEGGVVLAEEGLAAHALGLFGDVDVAVAHGLDLAVGDEGVHLGVAGVDEVEDVLPVVDDAEGHHAVERCDLFHLDLFLVVFHCCEGFVRRRSDSLAIYSRTSSSLPLGLINQLSLGFLGNPMQR